MLVFRTVTPINKNATLQELIDISIKWADNSPNYEMNGKLSKFYGKKEFNFNYKEEKISCFMCSKDNDEYACFSFKRETPSEHIEAEFVYKKSNNELLGCFSVYCQVSSFKYVLNDIKSHI